MIGRRECLSEERKNEGTEYDEICYLLTEAKIAGSCWRIHTYILLAIEVKGDSYLRTTSYMTLIRITKGYRQS